MGKRLTVAAVSTLVAFGLAELGARMHLGDEFVQGAYVGPPQQVCGRFDPDRGWANLERSHATIAAPEAIAGETYHVTINAAGNRGPERDSAKREGVQRVLVLGDSTAWGWGVDDSEVWTELVDARLGDQVEVVNLAVPGYGTDQQLLQLERVGAAWQPDVVLLAFVHNDLTSNPHPVYNGMGKPVLARDEQGVWGWTNQPVPAPDSDGQLGGVMALRRAGMHVALLKLFEPPRPRFVRRDLDDPAVLAGIDKYWDRLVDPDRVSHELLRRLRVECEELGAELVAFVIPHLHDRYLYEPASPPPAAALEALAAGSFETYGSRRLTEAGRLLDFETFSIDQALLEVVTTGTNLDCGDEHLNARGNQIVAEVVAHALTDVVERAR